MRLSTSTNNLKTTLFGKFIKIKFDRFKFKIFVKETNRGIFLIDIFKWYF